MHQSGIGRTRLQRVAQVRAGQDPSIREYGAYVPVGNAVEKLQRWQQQRAQLDYLSSHRNRDDVAADAHVLREHGFPPGRVLARQPGQSYGELAGSELPDVLIEDDCASIGTGHIASLQIRADLRRRIKSIIVPEFGGIDHLPDSLQELIAVPEASRDASEGYWFAQGSGPGEIAPDGSAVELYTLLPAGDEPQLIHTAIPDGASILELGAGTSRITRPLVELGHPVVAIDESAAMLAHIRRAETVCSPIQRLDLDRRFDVVLLASHLINAPDGELRHELLRTCRRHLADAGCVLI